MLGLDLGSVPVEHYKHGWDRSPPILQSDEPPREQHSTNPENQFNGKRYKKLLKGTTSEGVASASSETKAQETVELDMYNVIMV